MGRDWFRRPDGVAGGLGWVMVDKGGCGWTGMGSGSQTMVPVGLDGSRQPDEAEWVELTCGGASLSLVSV